MSIRLEEKDLLKKSNCEAANKNVALCAPLQARGAAHRLPPGAHIVLRVGETRVFSLGCVVSKMTAGNDPWVLSSGPGPTEIVMRGVEVGRSTLVGWCSDGTRRTFPVSIE